MRMRGDQGWVSVFAALIIPVVVWATGALALDLPRQLNAIGEASDLAANAARAGGQSVSTGAARSGHREIDTVGAVTRANSYLASTGRTGTVSVNGDTITVTVELGVQMMFVPGQHRVSATRDAVIE